MTGTILDLVQADIPEGKEGFLELASRAPSPKDDSFLNTIKDYGKTAIKGTAEGLGSFGRMMGPLETGKTTPQQLEEQTQALDVALPTDEGYVQRGLRRGLKQAPTALGFPGASLATLPRAIAAGFAGEAAKDLGAPEWAQAAAEITMYVGPDVMKKLLTSGKNEDLIKRAKELGMTDEQLAPLLQSDFKTKWLSKLTSKRGATQEALKESKRGVSDIYTSLQKSPVAANPIGQTAKSELAKSFRTIFEDMPAGVREQIKNDFKDLVSKPITGDRLINFYADINHYLGADTKQLSLLKDPIKKALGSISPELEKDFALVNDLYSKYAKISSKLSPTLTDDIIKAVEVVGIVGSLVTGNVVTLSGFVGEKVLRKVAQQLLINPRYQQLGQKMAVAVNENKFSLAKKLIGEYSDLMAKDSPEISEKLKNMSDDEIAQFLNISHQEEKDEQKSAKK
jgi:hypothetical protein